VTCIRIMNYIMATFQEKTLERERERERELIFTKKKTSNMDVL
jgi:hypothetical protein